MIRIGLLVAALVAVVAIFASAIGDSPYPVSGTLQFSCAVLLEAGALWWWLDPARVGPLWLRAILAAVLGLVALWYSAQDTLGAPEYVFMHQRWLAAVILGAGALTIASGYRAARRRREV